MAVELKTDKRGNAHNKARSKARSMARLAAIQALYQMDMTAIDLNDVILEFEQHRFGEQPEEAAEGESVSDAERAFFSDLTRGVVREQRVIDPLIDQRLAAGWRLARIDSILRAILRAGAYEILLRKDVPPRVSINEYVDIAHAFFEGEEPKVVNGVLDRIAKEVRPEELARPADADEQPTAGESGD